MHFYIAINWSFLRLNGGVIRKYEWFILLQMNLILQNWSFWHQYTKTIVSTGYKNKSYIRKLYIFFVVYVNVIFDNTIFIKINPDKIVELFDTWYHLITVLVFDPKCLAFSRVAFERFISRNRLYQKDLDHLDVTSYMGSL